MIVEKLGGNVGPDGTPVVKILWLVGFFALFAIGPILAQRRKVAAGLICPACQKKFQAVSGMIVVASGRCGFCGADVCV
jgi:hypothetical protein